MLRSNSGPKSFARPRPSGGMYSSSKKSKQRCERPLSPEDLNPPTILREHGRRGEKPLSSGGTNPSLTMKGHKHWGEGPLSCAENPPSTTRQQERKDVSSLFFVGTNPSTTMKKHRQKGEGPLSCAENKASTTRHKLLRAVRFFSSDEVKSFTPMRKQAWRSESPLSSSSEDDQPSTTRRQQQQSPVSFIEISLSTTLSQDGQSGGSPSSSDEVEPFAPMRLQAWRSDNSLSFSSEKDKPSTPRRQQHGMVRPSTTLSQDGQSGGSPSSSEEEEPSTARRQQSWRGESSSSSEEDEPSNTRRQQQQSPVSFIEISLSTTLSQDGQSGSSPSSSDEVEPFAPMRIQAWRSESSLSSSDEDDESANSFLSIHLSARGNLGDARQNEATERVKRERERCEKIKNKNQEEERKTFGLLSRIYIWWLNRKIDRIAREIQSTVVDERNLLRHGHLGNSKKMAEKERLLDRRTKLVVYKRRQEFKVEREVRRQRLKVKRTEEKVSKMENISELCENPERPKPDRRRLNLYSV
ncbi:suppressor protein SRP40 [Etheostoma spectabile]|uniref:suppressor protein SRP40 n=1 Tax=Etheostoma spectabile TaxID=54343 RepID=UPI0013AF0692|nr:suppressor protein SRP40-like [Etheostoma spectabile]